MKHWRKILPRQRILTQTSQAALHLWLEFPLGRPERHGVPIKGKVDFFSTDKVAQIIINDKRKWHTKLLRHFLRLYLFRLLAVMEERMVRFRPLLPEELLHITIAGCREIAMDLYFQMLLWALIPYQ